MAETIACWFTIPFPPATEQRADIYLGQTDEFTDQVTSPTDSFRPDADILESAPNTFRTPLALAWDGTNLYVSDPADLRVMVFTPGSSQYSDHRRYELV